VAPAPPQVLANHLPLELSLAFGIYTYRCSIVRERGKMTIHYGTEHEMLTLTAKGLKVRGSDDDFEENIEQRERTEQTTCYFVVPWQLTCVLRQQEQSVYVDLFHGEQTTELITLRIA
jgi:hypothetical protein